MKYRFINCFTGTSFVGTVDELHFRLAGNHESIFSKEDVISSYGWHCNKKTVVG